LLTRRAVRAAARAQDDAEKAAKAAAAAAVGAAKVAAAAAKRQQLKASRAAEAAAEAAADLDLDEEDAALVAEVAWSPWLACFSLFGVSLVLCSVFPLSFFVCTGLSQTNERTNSRSLLALALCHSSHSCTYPRAPTRWPPKATATFGTITLPKRPRSSGA
jgi:hypothetical protein